MNRFCTKCGTKDEGNSKFCQECGAELPALKTQRASTGTANMPSLSQFSKKTKMIIVSCLALLIVFFGIYKLGESATDKGKLLDKFSEAVESEDVDALTELLVSGKEGTELKAENIAVMLDYWNEYDYVKDNLFTSLKDQSRAYDRSDSSNEAVAFEGDDVYESFVYLKRDGKKFLFFDNYELTVYPIELLLETNYSDATYTVNGEAVEVEELEWDMINLGKYLPGNYEVKGVLKNDYVEISEELSITLNNSNDYEWLYFEVAEVYVETSLDGAKVLVNGKDTGQTISSYGDYFGPVLTDGSMAIQFEAETPFGNLTSVEYLIDGSTIYPEFPVDDQLQEELIAGVNESILSWFQALMTRDVSQLKNVTGDEREEIESNIEELNANNEYFIGYLDQITYDLDEFQVYYEDGSWHASLPMAFDYEYTEYDSDLEPYFYEGTEDLLVSLKYENGQWNIYYFDSTYFDPSNEEIHTFDRAEQEKNKPELKVSLNAEQLMNDYLYSMVFAINYDAFEEVESYLLPDSELYNSQKALVTRLYEKGVTEEVIAFDILNVEELNDEESRILVSETIGIYSEGEYREETFQWWYYAKRVDTRYYLYKLETAELP